MARYSKIIWRLVILMTLTGCLLFLDSDRQTVLAVTTCTTCDNNYSTCAANCLLQWEQCSPQTEPPCKADRDACYEACFNTYAFCIGGCTFDSGSGGGGSSCGRGRTECEQSCIAGRQDCVANGGTSCGQDYQSCVEGCCSP